MASMAEGVQRTSAILHRESIAPDVNHVKFMETIKMFRVRCRWQRRIILELGSKREHARAEMIQVILKTIQNKTSEVSKPLMTLK